MPDQTAAGPFLSRYLAGEHEAVWSELRALGPAVREPGLVDDAWSVAIETMKRARRNVSLIIRRLDRLGYRFWDGVQGSLAARLSLPMSIGGVVTAVSPAALAMRALSIDPTRSGLPNTSRHIADLQTRIAEMLPAVMAAQAKQSVDQEARQAEAAAISNHLKDASVFAPANRQDRAWLAELERRGMVLPMSLRAWCEVVGAVNLAGAHPWLCFWEDADFPGVYADPLMVDLDHFRFLVEGWLEEREERGAPEPFDAIVSLSPALKAGLAVAKELLDDGYALELPHFGADADLVFEGKRIAFVDFLRNAFRWGGFPGWADQPTRPSRELLTLSSGLSPL